MVATASAVEHSFGHPIALASDEIGTYALLINANDLATIGRR
jgi:hydrogenase maturation factor